jgi:uncharacterized membrane protein
MTIPKDLGHALAAPALILAAEVSLWVVTASPAGNPIRVVAGLALFIALPGIGLQRALMRPTGGLASWEIVALVGALGLAASSLASVLMLAAGVALTESSVGLMCAAITVLAAMFDFIRPESRRATRPRLAQTLGLVAVLGVIALGSVVGAAVSTKPADRFTVFAFEDPGAARTVFESGDTPGTGSTINLIVESHEAAAQTFQVLVEGGARSPAFVLEPSERVVVPVEIDPGSGDDLKIELLRDGSPYRSLKLSAS